MRQRHQVQLDTKRLHYSEITLKATFHHTPDTVRRAFALIAEKQDSVDGLHHRRGASLPVAARVAPHAEPQRRYQDRHHSRTLMARRSLLTSRQTN